MLYRLLLIACLTLSFRANAQAPKDTIYDPNKEVVVNGNRFKVYNNWLNGGAGYAEDFTNGLDLFWLGLDYNFHIKKDYFQLGAFASGRDFGDYYNYNFHLGYVKRWESIKWNFCGFGGAAYNTGFPLDSGRFDLTTQYKEFGLYAGGQAIFKLKYDIGLGISGLANWNPYAFSLGARIDIYFSGAFKGKKK